MMIDKERLKDQLQSAAERRMNSGKKKTPKPKGALPIPKSKRKNNSIPLPEKRYTQYLYPKDRKI